MWCIKALSRKIASNQIREQYPSLNVSTLLGNPEAYLQNKRFIDDDLNRQFLKDSLHGGDDLDEDDLPMETLRAREIDQIIGPKFAGGSGSDEPANSVVIDLHSTTSNMGLTIIVAEGDPVMTRA